MTSGKFENFNRNMISDGALALVGSSVAASIDGIAEFNNYVPLFNPILDGAFYSNFLLIPRTVIDTVNVGCDKETGSWDGSDLCKL